MIGSEIRAQSWKWLSVALAVLAVAAVVACVFLWVGRVSADARADAAETRKEELASALKAANETIAQERAHAKAMQRIGEQYERDRADAQTQYERDLADLRAGTLRLRKQWTCPAVPEAIPGVARPDDGAELREQGAADLVRLAREADAQIRGLQNVIKADREIGAEE